MQHFPLDIGLFRFHFRVLDNFSLPSLMANTWRSVLGMQLKRMSEGRAAVPENLPIPAADLYTYFMETPPPPDARLMRLYRQTPHPWLFVCPWNVRELPLHTGEEYTLPLVLLGRANALLSVFVLALSRAAAQGLGKQRGRMRLMRVEQIPEPPEGGPVTLFEYGGALREAAPWRPEVPEMPKSGHLILQLKSPLRLVVRKQLMNPRRFVSPYPLLMNLVRRASMLCAFHGEAELQADYAALKTASERVAMPEKRLQWHDQHRWSSRTQQRVPLGGMMGEIMLDISAAPEIWPFLWLGQWLHAGKGTVLGLGRYKLQPG